MKVYEAQYCSGTEDVCVGRGERHGFAEEYTASLPVKMFCILLLLFLRGIVKGSERSEMI